MALFHYISMRCMRDTRMEAQYRPCHLWIKSIILTGCTVHFKQIAVDLRGAVVLYPRIKMCFFYLLFILKSISYMEWLWSGNTPCLTTNTNHDQSGTEGVITIIVLHVLSDIQKKQKQKKIKLQIWCRFVHLLKFSSTHVFGCFTVRYCVSKKPSNTLIQEVNSVRKCSESLSSDL